MQPLSFTTIESFDSVHEANVAVAVLAENGIDCFTENATLIANDWLLAGAVGGVKVQVPLSQASIAREVLDAWRKSRADRVDAGKDQWIVFRCSGCRELIAIGAENANRVENCPLCRRYVDVPAESDPTLTKEVCQATIQSSKTRMFQRAEQFLNAPWFLILECMVVLGLAYMPYQVWAIYHWQALNEGESSYIGFLSTQNNANLTSRSFIVIVCVLAVLLVRGSLRPYGITLEKAVPDTILGIAIGMGLVTLNIGLISILGIPDFSAESPESLPTGIEGWIALLGSGLLAVLLNSIAEELVMRGYLTVRVEQLAGNAFLTVSVPALLFASYHIYQGVWGAVLIGITGLALGVWFYKTRRLLGPIVAHTCMNLYFLADELLWSVTAN
jgi:membrane protease YdiL (CAAX protease family)